MREARSMGVVCRSSERMRRVHLLVTRTFEISWLECSLKKIRMFRHPCILKYIEGNESDTGVFYVSVSVTVR